MTSPGDRLAAEKLPNLDDGLNAQNGEKHRHRQLCNP